MTQTEYKNGNDFGKSAEIKNTLSMMAAIEAQK